MPSESFFFLFLAQMQPPTLSVVAFGIQIKILFKCAIKHIILEHLCIYRYTYIALYIGTSMVVYNNNMQHNSFIFHCLRLFFLVLIRLCVGANYCVGFQEVYS